MSSIVMFEVVFFNATFSVQNRVRQTILLTYVQCLNIVVFLLSHLRIDLRSDTLIDS